MRSAVFLSAGLLACSGPSIAAAAERMDEATLRTVETRWSEAFVTGDAPTLEALLAPDYVSVGANGKARPKAEVVAIAKTYAAAHPGEHASPLPTTSTVQLMGTTALVRHHSPSDVSIDLFAFEKGRWIARYSQHTAIAPPA